MLGEITSWDGQTRNTTVEDYQKRFSSVGSSHLKYHLENSLKSATSAQSSESKSLLSQLVGFFDASDLAHIVASKELTSNLANLYVNLRTSKHTQRLLKDRKVYLETTLTLQRESQQYEESDDSSNSSSDVICLDEKIVPVLKEVGKSKELTRVSLKMVDEQSKEIELRKEIDEVVLSLQHLGCAENSVDRGYVDSGLSWLHARSLGLISSCASLSRTLTSSANPSVRRIERMRLTKFNLQWTISGHMMNPTYCVLFDPSGKYVFTGADDYLVKLWDVEKGLLLRTFRGHMSYISHLVLSPDGSLMASGCTMGTIRLWRLSDGVCVQVLKHKASINWLMFDKHTGALASASDDGQCTVWDINRLLQDDLCDIPLLDVIARRMGCSSSHSFNTKSFTASMSNNKFDQCDEERIIIPSEVIGTKACNSARFFLPVLFEEPTSLDTSNHEDEVAALVLPHIQDYHQITSRTVEPSKVNCLDISPAGGVLVTGCEDGVARIWRFGSFTEGRGKRAKVKSMDSALSNLRYKVSPNEYSRILQVTSQLLLRLEGHIASITDVHFNQSGDRVLTASLKEGSVRVWSLSKDYTNSIQIALDLSLENSHSDQAVQNKETRIRGGRRQNTSKTEAYNACWTNDGNRIITLQSVPIKGSSSTRYEPTRLKVWDSITGDLLKVIRRVSDLSCRTLVVHPINPSIVLTCGEDGFINFWDIEEEKLLSNQKILDDDGTDTFLVDASFSNDGLQVVATDTNGRLSLLTLDNSNRYSTSYNQQYFSSDYANIMIDDMGFAIDVGTQLPVHESPAGALCRLDGTAYESQPILDTSLPPPRSKFDLETMFDECQKIREELPARLELTFKTFLRHSSHGRSAQRYQATKYKDSRISQVVEASKTNSSIEKSPTKYVAKYKEFDYNTLFSSSEDSANDSDYGRQRLSTRSQRLVRGSNRSQSNHVATLPTRSTRNRASYVDNDDDDDNDESYERATQSRSERLRARERRRMILSDDESECSASTVDSEQDVDLYDSDSEVVARRKTREKDRAKSAALKAKRNIRRKKSRRSAVASSDSLLHIQSCGWSKHRASVPVGVEIDRTWLLVDSCNENQYCPQLGDRVFYFPQGHAEFLKSFTESISPPWMSFQDRWPLVECEVTKITYEFPTEAEFRRCPSVVVNVGLVILQTPSRRSITSSGNYTLDLVEPRATRHSQQNLFTVSIRNCHLPDFLVLSEVFMRSVKIPWHFGVKISVQYKETNEDGDISFKQYMGSVVRLSNASDDWPNSPWEALEVRWDDEDGSIENAGANSVERLGPWEATPLLDSSSNSTATRAQYKLKTLDTAETSRIVEEVNKLMTENDEEYNPFMYEVDGSVYPDYYSLIATPSYVDLIVRRLENYFYRQVRPKVATDLSFNSFSLARSEE